MKLFRVNQVSAIDKYTIVHEPITSIDLMERASQQIFKKITELFSEKCSFIVVAGPGNNGGDGLAVARILFKAGYKVSVILVQITGSLSADCQINYKRLKSLKGMEVLEIRNVKQLKFKKQDIIIDALFGSGLSRKLEGLALQTVIKMNGSGCKIVSIDIPSGLFGEENTINDNMGIVNADITLTLQFPKISFFFAENKRFIGKWFVLPIGLHPEIMEKEYSPYHYLEGEDIIRFIKIRETFSHKGTYGHALLISGSYGKMGAAILASKACIRSGAGLLTTHIPKCGYEILQISIPEAMASVDTSKDFVSELPEIKNYTAIGVGPGLGTHGLTSDFFYVLLKTAKQPLVLDADALNILSENKKWLKLLPENSILTPHPKEFDRLCGISHTSYERHLKAIEFSKKYNVTMVLKGAYTQVISPKGICYFNSTGNPGMATGGSGDVLTGIILGLLSQGYSTIEASVLGVYLHGLSGDLAISKSSQEALIASDIINNIGNAYSLIHSK